MPIQLGTGALFGVNAQSLLGHLGYSKANLAAGVEQPRSKQGKPRRLVVAP